MKRPIRKRVSSPANLHSACGERDVPAQGGGAGSASPERQVVSVRLIKSIFGAEKIERLLGAMHFSRDGTILRRAAGGHFHVRRLGLLLVLLFLQSLFIAIDYLPVTLEVLSRDRACTYIHESHE